MTSGARVIIFIFKEIVHRFLSQLQRPEGYAHSPGEALIWPWVRVRKARFGTGADGIFFFFRHNFARPDVYMLCEVNIFMGECTLPHSSTTDRSRHVLGCNVVQCTNHQRGYVRSGSKAGDRYNEFSIATGNNKLAYHCQPGSWMGGQTKSLLSASKVTR